MIKKNSAILICFIFALITFSGCSPSGEKEIKIGAILPLNGKILLFGTQARDAINMAVEEINSKGGVLDGKKLRVIVMDDEANPEKTKDAFSKLVSRDKIVALIGGITSDSALTIAPLAQKNKIVMITPTATSWKITRYGGYIFRACFDDPFQGMVDARFAKETLNAKKAAVLFDDTNDYSKGLMESFVEVFSSSGGQIPVIESYSSQSKDISVQLSKIKAANVDIIFVPNYYNEVSRIAKQIRSSGITTTLLGTDGWDDIASNTGDEVLGSYFSDHYTKDLNDPDVKKFAENYKSKYKTDSNAFAALSYDSVYLLANAIEEAGSADPDKIKEALKRTDKKYVTGHIKFDENRNPIKTAYILKINKVDGKLVQTYHSTVNP